MGVVQCIVNPARGANDSQLEAHFWSPRAPSFSTIPPPIRHPSESWGLLVWVGRLERGDPSFRWGDGECGMTENVG